jgi:murein DD-endopeptidase MepM/ murein hydrolase activator NlpD
MRKSSRALFLFFLLAGLAASGSAQATAVLPGAPSRSRANTPHLSVAPRITFRPVARSPESSLVRIREQLKVRRRLLMRARQEERFVLGQLSWAEERFRQAEAHLRQTVASLVGARRAVGRATDALQVVSQRLSAHEALMGPRLRAFYERGSLGYLDVLLGAVDIRDFITRSYLMGRIINRDLHLFQRVGEEQRQRDEVRAELVEREQRLAQEQALWSASREQTARLAAERRRVLQHLRAERVAQEAAIRELEAESIRITEIIRGNATGQAGGPGRTLRSGALLWPVPGGITSGYGWRIHPIFHTREFHTGIDIGAPWGAPVHAAADGTVLFTGWMQGYGMLVILDHGNGLSTTYSHLSSYAVGVGDRVQKGDMIGRIGSTGWSTGPHLFFEIRHNGRPVNPLGP